MPRHGESIEDVSVEDGSVRPISCYGDGYSENPLLSKELDDWLAAAGEPVGRARAIIAPHASYCWSGATSAHAFKQIVPENIRRVFILGPSHFHRIYTCVLSTRSKYRTPFGDMNVDREVTEKLFSSGHFDWFHRKFEDQEHSIEMLLPFLAKVMESQPMDSYTIIPVMIGHINGITAWPDVGCDYKLDTFGSLFAPYLEDPTTLFLISSDFSHWGRRFRDFIPHDPSSSIPIHEQIAAMDKKGMDAISSLNLSVFNDYLKRTKNTICGRNAIGVLMQAINLICNSDNDHTYELRFLDYSQSSQVLTLDDTSVAYAAGALFIHPK